MSLCVGAHVPFINFETLETCPYDCIQIYFGNNSNVSLGQLLSFRKSGKKLFVHASLMYNLCGSKEGESCPKYKRNLEFARNGLAKDLDICAVLGAPLVVHVGAAKDRGWGISKVAETVDFALSQKSCLTDKFSKALGRDIRRERLLLLENCAGEGTKLGRDIPELSSLWSQIKNKEQTKFCIDTCHGFASGTMNFGTKEGIQEFWKDWTQVFPEGVLHLFHLNDSKTPFGSKVDRHETLLCGHIWDEKPEILQYFLESAKERGVPLVLERKDDTIEKELEICKALTS
ncbi:putative endonuclease family 2 [Tunisvirus fontaine2]|uniref:Putative endonuclease family 2 n=1 Tax=Tunisvirus fontaine2 TaxID=1421067 RepID=V9SGN8_9VIRU|nr:putative endonuclease family 2 [Tunisvirus fontaine2]AHC54932.1 putative endonuclease family 2 [Tunisvirus fontaine2]